MALPPPLIAVDASRCTGCGACVEVCPHRLLAQGEGRAPLPDPEVGAFCIGCGHCAAVCPTGALVHAGLEAAPEATSPPPEGEALAWLRSRRSVRAYRPEPLLGDEVRVLLQAARYAPTGHNACGVGCVAVLSPAGRAELLRAVVGVHRRFFRLLELPGARALLGLLWGTARRAELEAALPSLARAEARLARGEDPLFHGAPAVLLFHAAAGETAEADCVLAAGEVSLYAPSLGLGTCHVGYATAALRRFPGLGRAAGVPRGERVYAVLTAGRPRFGYRRAPARPPTRVRFR